MLSMMRVKLVTIMMNMVTMAMMTMQMTIHATAPMAMLAAIDT